MEEPKSIITMILLNQKLYPKDVSRCVLQIICSENCGIVFREILGIEKLMVACHKPSSLQDLAMPSKLKDSNETRLKGSTCVAK